MRRSTTLAAALLWAASAAAAPARLPVDQPGQWTVTGPAAPASRVSAAAEKKDGAAPLAVDYKFAPGANDFIFLESPLALPGVPKSARLSVFGDGSGASLRMNVTDGGGEMFQAYLIKVEWEGWKELELPVEFPIHWGGDNNAKMDGALVFHSLVVNSERDQKKSAGRILLARFELSTALPGGAPAPSAASAGKGAATGKSAPSDAVVLDDFERANPSTVFQTWKGDDSTIELLSSSEFKQGGNFSMQLSYKLVTSRSVPSWVSAGFTPVKPLNWEGVQKLVLWVKGDGTRNRLQIRFQDGTDRVWVYQDAAVMKNVGWVKMEADLAKFQPTTRGRGGPPTLNRIQKYEFAVEGEESKISSGRIWLDNFSTAGAGLDAGVVSARPAVSQEVVDKVKIGVGDTLHVEYRSTPEFNREVLFYNSVLVRASAKNISVSADLVSVQTDFGKTIPFQRASATAPPLQPEERNRPDVELGYVNASLQNLHPNISAVSVGNLYIDYGRDVFSPIFGFKGIQADGKVEGVQYNLFAVKHIYDAHTLGGRLQGNDMGFLWRAMGVSYRDRARTSASSNITNGQLTQPDAADLKTETVASDDVVFADVTRPFWKERLDLTAAWAQNRFSQERLKDVAVPEAPVVDNQVFTPVQKKGDMVEAKLRIQKIPFEQTRVIVGYRNLHRNFRPFFRADPFKYDHEVADVRGWSGEFEQIAGRFKLNLFYEDVDRGAPSDDYFRRTRRASLGAYNMNRWDLVGAVTQIRDFYALSDPLRSEVSISASDPRNEDFSVYEIFLGHWFTETFQAWAKVLVEDKELLNTGRKVRKDTLVFQMDWAVQENAKIALSILKSGFADPTYAQTATSDNAVRTDDRTQDSRVRASLDIHF